MEMEIWPSARPFSEAGLADTRGRSMQKVEGVKKGERWKWVCEVVMEEKRKIWSRMTWKGCIYMM